MSTRFIVSSLAAAATIVVLGAAAEGRQQQSKPSRYLYVWGGTGMHGKAGANVVAVIDVDPASSKYGTVINAVTVDTAGGMPHHTELELPKTGPLFANDFGTGRNYLIDFSDPLTPRARGRTMDVPGARMPHSFARLANGHVLTTIQFGGGKVAGDPGGLAEFDGDGKLVRFTSSVDPAFPEARIRTYALTTLPAIDRVVTTSSPMDTERTANVVQVWRLSDLKLLKTVAVPDVATDSADTYPFELKTLADGRTVMMHTYYCGFYKLTGLDGEPKIERVLALEHPKNIGCSVPLLAGKFMVVPIAYAHRVATLDISDPSHPVEVSSFATDSTYYPHWIARDPGSDRVVLVDQGDGRQMIMMGHLDTSTGRLRWDEKFRDRGAAQPGVSFANVQWRNGIKGMVMPHGTLFVP